MATQQNPFAVGAGGPGLLSSVGATSLGSVGATYGSLITSNMGSLPQMVRHNLRHETRSMIGKSRRIRRGEYSHIHVFVGPSRLGTLLWRAHPEAADPGCGVGDPSSELAKKRRGCTDSDFEDVEATPGRPAENCFPAKSACCDMARTIEDPCGSQDFHQEVEYVGAQEGKILFLKRSASIDATIYTCLVYPAIIIQPTTK